MFAYLSAGLAIRDDLPAPLDLGFLVSVLDLGFRTEIYNLDRLFILSCSARQRL